MEALGAPSISSGTDAARSIRNRAGASLLKSRATKLCLGSDGAADADVPANFWGNGGGKLPSEDWQRGDFSTWKGKPQVRWSAYGVQFCREDAEKMGAAFTQGGTVAGPPRRGGAPAKIADWHAFWLAAMTMLDAGELTNFKSQASLRKALLAKINDSLSEDAIKAPAREIWFSFIDRPSSTE